MEQHSVEGERQTTCAQTRPVQIRRDVVKTVKYTDILESDWAFFRYMVKEILLKEAPL